MRPWVSSRAFPLLGWLGDMGALWPSLLWGLSRVLGVLAFHLSLMGIPGGVGAVPLGLGGLGVFFFFPFSSSFFRPPGSLRGGFAVLDVGLAPSA